MFVSSFPRLPVLPGSSGRILQLPGGTAGGPGTGASGGPPAVVQAGCCCSGLGHGVGALPQLSLPCPAVGLRRAHGLSHSGSCCSPPAQAEAELSSCWRFPAFSRALDLPFWLRSSRLAEPGHYVTPMWLGLLSVAVLSADSCVLSAGRHLNKWLQPGHRACLGRAGQPRPEHPGATARLLPLQDSGIVYGD